MRPRTRPRPASAASRRRAWWVEALECRTLLSVVSNTNDSGPGSFRDAIANATPGEVITFDPSLQDAYISPSSPLEIKTSLTIQGLGADHLTVSAFGFSNVFTVDRGVVATISGLTITNGQANDPLGGGGVVNAGTLTLSDDVVTNNRVLLDVASAASGGGGGIRNTGTLTLDRTTVSSNSVQVEGSIQNGPTVPVYGGGIWNDGGTLTALDSAISGNSLASLGLLDFGYLRQGDAPSLVGAGIASTGGDVTIEGSTISDNTAAGAIFQYFNPAPGYRGTAGGDVVGGGIALVSGRLWVLGSTIASNSITGGAGGLGSYGGFRNYPPYGEPGGAGGTAAGGGIEVAGGNATIEGSTITDNSAVGGAGGDGGPGNSFGATEIVSGFDGGDGGAAGMASGGGVNIEAGAGPVAVIASTVTANTARGGDGGYGGYGGYGYGHNPYLNADVLIYGSGGRGGEAGSAAGGGIDGGAGLTILNSTLTGNQAFGGSGGGGGGGFGGQGPDANGQGGSAGGDGGAGGDAIGANLSAAAASVVANGTIGPDVGTAAGVGGAGGGGGQSASPGIPNGPAGSNGVDGTGSDSAPFVQLSIQFSGYRYNRVNHHLVQLVTVTQVGGPAFGGTLSLALDGLPSGVTLADTVGTTTATVPTGSPYVTVNLEEGPTTILLDFADPTLAQVKFRPRLIAGTP